MMYYIASYNNADATGIQWMEASMWSQRSTFNAPFFWWFTWGSGNPP
jgi:hypothetical protein